MNGDFWLNLSSKNLDQAKEFYLALGFELNLRHSGPDMVSFFVGHQKLVLNLFPESMLQGFMNQPVTDATKTNEIIFSLGADSPKAVDALAEKAVAAGARLYGKPGYKDGWMYGCGFADPDGHRWSVLYMDLTKMPRN